MSLYFDIHSHQKTKIEQNCVRCNNVSQIEFSIFENLSEKPHQFYSAGLHPWYITETNWESDLVKLEHILQNRKVIALGECGLDNLRGAEMKLQEKIFIAQLKLAEKLDLPVIVHCVRAYNELARIVKAEKNQIPIIIHGFQSKMSILKPLLHAGFYISLGEAVFSNKTLNWAEILTAVPNESLFLETDDKNISIELIYEEIAELKNTSMDILKEIIKENVKQVFSKI